MKYSNKRKLRRATRAGARYDKGMTSNEMSKLHTKLRTKGYSKGEAFKITGQAKALSKTLFYNKTQGRFNNLTLNYTEEELKELGYDNDEIRSGFANAEQEYENKEPPSYEDSEEFHNRREEALHRGEKIEKSVKAKLLNKISPRAPSGNPWSYAKNKADLEYISAYASEPHKVKRTAKKRLGVYQFDYGT